MTTLDTSLDRADTETPAPVDNRPRRALGYGLLAALAFVPPLLTATGRVAADTKQYLYLDPERLLERAPSMWDPNIGLGTVTHQNIGYLLPMGPYYWLMDRIGFPDWFAQRIWLGALLFAAGTGVLYLARTIGLRGPGAVVAALAYMLSPYSLHYAARISVILLPWAALGWLLGFMVRALRQGGWRHPALIAITVQVIGGVNATALVFAMLVPLLWVPYAVWIAREVDWRRAALTLVRTGLLTLLASLWWIAGLWAQGSYGINILRYTETVKTVAEAGLAPEVLRGLGYWFFYGGDKLGNWIEASVEYTQNIPLILAGYAIPVLALLAAALVRWRHRIYFAFLMLVGVAIAVGVHPYDDPSPFGAVLKAFAEGSTAGLALRSVGRAVPLVALASAMLLGAGITALVAWLDQRRLHTYALGVVGLVGVLIVVSLPALWNDSFYGKNLQRPEDVPRYWTEAIAALDRESHDTRVMEVPGSDFASYRWGNTVDPITPGLMDRPYVARELIPYGTPEANDLLNALDERMQEGVLEPGMLVPIARLMSVGDVVARNDLQIDRYNLVRPEQVMQLLAAPEADLGRPTTHGRDLGAPLRFPLLDEQALAEPAGTKEPAPVVVFPVPDTPAIVHAQPVDAPVVVAGSGDGLVDLAGVGGLDGRGIVVYSASYADDRRGLRERIDDGDAVLVVTDSNRRRARRWSTVRENVGYTERAGEKPLVDDPSDARLDVFTGAGDDAFTVVDQRGVQVDASGYGNNITYTPDDRPAFAIDGNADTAWRVGAFAPVDGERIRFRFDERVDTSSVNLVQARFGDANRWITRATLTFDGKDELEVDLDEASRRPEGQTITFPKRTFRTLEIRIDDTDIGKQTEYTGLSGVGFSEVRIHDDPGAPDRHVEEVVRMPVDLGRAAGARSIDHRLVYSIARSRTLDLPPRHNPDERTVVRAFDVPAAREFSLRGGARLSSVAADDVLDDLLAGAAPAPSDVVVTSSGRLPGARAARASSALDGSSDTAWTSPFGGPAGQWIEVATPAPVTVDHLDLQVVADGRHSVPTRLRIDAGGESQLVDVPAITDGTRAGETTEVPLDFEPVTGSTVRVTVDAIRPVRTLEFYSQGDIDLPVAIAELGIPGVQVPGPAGDFTTGCRADLLTIDGTPVPVTVQGTVADALAGKPLDVQTCTQADVPTPPVVPLTKGEHVLRATDGATTGIDLDTLVLASEAGGDALELGERGELPPVATAAQATAPNVEVVDNGRTNIKVRVTDAQEPFWLVLGESHSRGWEATVDGDGRGPGVLVNGYANGWRIDPGDRTSFDVTLEWTPQRNVWIAIGVSALALLVCLALALRLWPRRRRPPALPGADAAPVLRAPFATEGSQQSVRVVVVATVLAGLGAGLLVKPLVGLLVGVLVALALVRPRARLLLALGAPAALALAGLYIAVQQYRHDYPSVFEWPTFFDRVQTLGWLAVVLLAADALVEVVRTRRRGRASAS